MRKFLLIKLLFCMFFPVFAKDEIPIWFKDFRSIYPDSEYIAQRGIGDSPENAKTDAAGALGRYFQTNVDSSIKTTMISETTDSNVNITSSVIDEVKIDSKVEFIGLEYTEPYYSKKEKKWYCVAFINRHNAWEQFKPQIEECKHTFESQLQVVEKEAELLTKLSIYKEVWNKGRDLNEKLEYGRILLPSEENKYESYREMVAEIPVRFRDIKKQCSVYLEINDDYGRMIISAISTAFVNNGFQVAKQKNDSKYIVEITIDDNSSGDNPVSILPEVNISVLSNNEKNNISIYSYDKTAKEKTVSYTLENAKKKAYSKFSSELETEVYESLNNSFSL
ncbi:MAG: hypothetical protein IJ688_01555 [Treponema sp.]|nr:hypothetical protein [Treponema sp.]